MAIKWIRNSIQVPTLTTCIARESNLLTKFGSNIYKRIELQITAMRGSQFRLANLLRHCSGQPYVEASYSTEASKSQPGWTYQTTRLGWYSASQKTFWMRDLPVHYVHLEKSQASPKFLQGCILNYNLSIVYFHLIKIILGNIITKVFLCENDRDTHQSIWQIAAILESEILFLLLWHLRYFLQ